MEANPGKPTKIKAINWQEQYSKNHKLIKNLIIEAEEPGNEEINIEVAFRRSKVTLGSYVTLDWTHKSDIRKISTKIKEYSLDVSQKRPLNFLMTAEPGSGKSHFVKCLAKMENNNISAVTFNMATFKKSEDFIHPIDEVRNLKVQDKLPVLFIDEFDSSDDNYSFLLPLLWDGEIQLSNRDFKLGKIVIILAGSRNEISKTITAAKKMEGDPILENSTSKLKDLLSRINGGDFEIPKLDLIKGERDRRVDKVCIALSLLQERFGHKLQLVPWALLNFISNTKFKYGVRSIAQFIDLINYSEDFTKEIHLEKLKLPLTNVTELKNSCLPYHLIMTESEGKDEIISRWNEAIKHNTLVRFVAKQPENEY